jgi:DNA modification methylase
MQALAFRSLGFKLHDTMIYQKNGNVQPTPPNHKRYHQTFEYMFILVKGNNGPKTFNPILDRPNKTGGTRAAYHNRLKDGTKNKSEEDNILIRMSGMRWNVWEYVTGASGTSEDKEAFNHPAIFPEKLAADHIESWSNEGDLILDPFAGSGTTLKMAHLRRRKWIGIEIGKEYVDLAEMRIKRYLPQQTLTNVLGKLV